MAKIKIDGIDYEVGSESHISALEKQASDAKRVLAEANKTTEAAQKRADDAEALAKSAQAETAKEKARADAAEAKADAKAIGKRVAARVGLLTIARTHLGPSYLADAAGAEPGEAAAAVDDDTIIRAVLEKLSPNLDTKAMDHAMLMGALLFGVSTASAEIAEAPMDAAVPAAMPGEDKQDPMAPAGFDSRLAPRGKIGEPNAATRRADGDDVKTQEQALRERARADAVAWQKPLRPRA